MGKSGAEWVGGFCIGWVMSGVGRSRRCLYYDGLATVGAEDDGGVIPGLAWSDDIS